MPVVLVVTDGVRPEALEQAKTPTFARLWEEGAWTLAAQSLMPTITLPCHMAMFYSVPSERHGILSNDYHPPVRPLPGLYEVIQQARMRSAAYYTWDALRDLSRPLTVSRTIYIETDYDDLNRSDGAVVEAALPDIAAGTYEFTFIHLGSTDESGHRHGWLSDEQLHQVEVVDGFIGQIVEALPDDTALLVQSDHGGHDRSHGTASPDDMTIPWLLYGAGIRQGHRIESPVTLLDTAPTIAHLLGLEAAREWEGRVVMEALIGGEVWGEA